jgi:signal peptidase I
VAIPNKKGTWGQALRAFLFPIFLVMSLRWAVVEPFVIPSGSMIPNLLVHDHILVQKFAFGLHIPFSDSWLWQWRQPERGEIIVFKYPENPEIYYIKRLVGLPGDRIEVQSGKIRVNDQDWILTPIKEASDLSGGEAWNQFDYYLENNGRSDYKVRFLSPESSAESQAFTVPEGAYFFMGDNRDQSSDSRVWGFVKNDYLVGRASMIWLSCHSTLPTMTFVCDPTQIRWERLFKKL